MTEQHSARKSEEKVYKVCKRCGHTPHVRGTNGCNCGCHFQVKGARA